ncbi:MAG: hypothetical protein PHY77_02205 [Desulfotomaculaceae bacterium]|nr:hypothetical protein [Desulfotomaculaceae bacterium]
MEGTKFCPVAKADCRKEQCAWWDNYINECAVVSAMLALWADVDEDDDDDENGEEEKNDEKGNVADEEFADGDIKEYVVKIKRLD